VRAKSTGAQRNRWLLVRFGPSGERRAERSVSVDVDWLVAVDETLVVGSAAGER